MTESEKSVVFEAILKAESEYLTSLHKRFKKEFTSFDDVQLCGAYRALYNLCCSLELDSDYREWRNKSTEEKTDNAKEKDELV